ncbi:MAG TPA: hypothetical protein VMZ69_00080 [Saprospiraceae bacterium]|nr:hypothetical protein [Saprospiraceae bacterium]
MCFTFRNAEATTNPSRCQHKQHTLITRKTKQNSTVPVTGESGRYLSIFLFCMFFLMLENTNAQSPQWIWARAIGGTDADHGLSVAHDVSGNVYTTGNFEGTVDFDPGPGIYELTSAGDLDIFITKLDGSGNFEWAISMGGPLEDGGSSITIDASGNVYTTGSFEGTADFNPEGGVFNLTSAGTSDIFVSKLNSSGDFVWAKAMSGTDNDHGFSIALDASGNVYTTGDFRGTVDFDPGAGVFNLTVAGFNDIFISKLNSSGNFVWAIGMGGTDNDRALSLAFDASGNIFISGSFKGTADFDPGAGAFNLTSAGETDIFICKLDNTGNFLWAAGMGSTDYDVANSLALDGAGNVHTTGLVRNAVDFDPGGGVALLTSVGEFDIFVSKLNSSGNFVWARAMGGTGGDSGEGLVLDASGNIYTTGIFRNTVDFNPGGGTFNLTSAGGIEIFISKLDASGNFVLANKAGGAGDDYGEAITLDASGNSYLTGFFASPSISFGSISLTNAGGSDMFVAKFGIGSGDPLSVSITSSTNVLCNGLNTGSATASASGGSPAYTYNWSNGGSGPTINNLAVGVYTVTVTDNNSATATASVSITQPLLLVLSPPSIINVSCDGGDDGSIQAIATGGVSPYLFNWSNGASGATILNLSAGSYTVTVTDNNNCTKTATYMVSEPAEIIISLVELVNESCDGEEDGSIAIAVTGGVNPSVAEWSNGFIGLSINDLPPGIYSVTVTDNNNCTMEATYTIDPGGIVELTTDQIQHVSCAGGANGNISITAAGGVAPYTYLWSNGNTGSAISGLSAGSYLVTVTDSHGCTAQEEYTINQPTAIDIQIMQPTQNLCFGDSTADLTSIVTGGIPAYSALWSNGINELNNSNLHAGTYTITITDANACTSVSSATINDPPHLTVTVSTTNETAVGANNGSATATPIGGTLVYNYLWSNGGTTAIITGLAPGTYAVTITDMNGCTVSGSGQVFAFGCTLDVILGGDQLICEEDTSIIIPMVNGPTGSYTYVWTDGSTGNSLLVSQGGEYCVTVTDGANCQDTDCIIISEINIPPITCPVTDESAPGANDGAVTCDGLQGITSYVWSNGANTSSITGLSPAQYCVTVTDGNGCTKSQCFNVQPANCQMSITSTQTNVSCNGDSTGSISLVVIGATEPVTYTWSNGESSATIDNLHSGIYSVTVADAAGCVESLTFGITEPLALDIIVDSIGAVNIPMTGFIYVSIIGGTTPYSSFWTYPNGEQVETEDLSGINTPGYYSLMVTDAAGCTATLDSVFVEQDVASDRTQQFKSLKVYPVPMDDLLFIDMEKPLTEVIISGVEGRLYKYMINPVSNKIDVSDLTPGWYLLRVSDGIKWYIAPIVKVSGGW